MLCRDLLAGREGGGSAGLAEDPPFLIHVLHVRPAPHTSFLTSFPKDPGERGEEYSLSVPSFSTGI